MYSTKLRNGKAFAAEEEIHKLKKLLLKSKCMKTLEHKRVKPNDLTRKAIFSLNNIKSPKYGFAPKEIKNKKAGKNFQEIYAFHRLSRVKKANLRTEKLLRKSSHKKKENIKKSS